MHLKDVVLIFLTIFASVEVFALKCKDTTNIEQSYSLRSPGEPLENMITQNQGSLGTCYANSLALSIEAITGVTPSIQQLSINSTDPGKTLIEHRKKEDLDGNIIESDDLYYEGGHICQTLDRSKDKTICTRESSPIEKYVSAGNTGVLFHLSLFYDTFSDNSPLENKEEFERAMMSVQTKIEEKIKSCKDYSKPENGLPPPEFGALEYIKNDLSYKYKRFNNIWNYCPKTNNRFKVSGVDKDGRKYQIGEQDQCYKNLEELKKEINELAIIDDERLKSKDPVSSFYEKNFVLTETNQQALDKKIDLPFELYPESHQVLHEYYGAIDEIMKKSIHAQNTDERNNNVKSFFIGKNWSADKSAEQVLSGLLENPNLFYYAHHDHKNYHLETCREKAIEASYPHNLRRIYEENFQLCVPESFIIMHFEIFKSFQKLNYPPENISEEINLLLSKMDQPMKEYLMGIINEDCLNKTPGTFIDMRDLNLSCKHEDWYEFKNEKRYKKDIKKAKKRLDKIVQKQLYKKKAPVNISICTSFFQDPNADSKFGSVCDRSKKHGYHGVAIIGNRCNNGVTEYQIQNSWGDSCSAYKDSNWETLYNCNENEGNLWVPEDTLVKNMMNLQTIEGKK